MPHVSPVGSPGAPPWAAAVRQRAQQLPRCMLVCYNHTPQQLPTRCHTPNPWECTCQGLSTWNVPSAAGADTQQQPKSTFLSTPHLTASQAATPTPHILDTLQTAPQQQEPSQYRVISGTGSGCQVMWVNDHQLPWVHLGGASLAGCQDTVFLGTLRVAASPWPPHGTLVCTHYFCRTWHAGAVVWGRRPAAALGASWRSQLGRMPKSLLPRNAQGGCQPLNTTWYTSLHLVFFLRDRWQPGAAVWGERPAAKQVRPGVGAATPHHPDTHVELPALATHGAHNEKDIQHAHASCP